MKGVMQKVQRFGGAMFTPVLLFSFAGIMVGLSTLFMNQSIFGALAAEEGIWYKIWYSGRCRYCLQSVFRSDLRKNKMRDVCWKHLQFM